MVEITETKPSQTLESSSINLIHKLEKCNKRYRDRLCQSILIKFDCRINVSHYLHCFREDKKNIWVKNEKKNFEINISSSSLT